MTRQRAGLPFAGCLLLALLLAACAAPATPGVTNTPDATAIPPTATAIPPTPTATPEPDLTQADLWAAGFTTVVNRADAFVIRKGDVTLDLSLLATDGDPQIPPALNPLRLHATLLEQFEVLAPVRLRAQVALAAARYNYTIEEGALLESRSAMSYTVGTLLFPVDGALIPAVLASADEAVRWAGDGALVLERLYLAQDVAGAPVWTVLARAEAPTWAWTEPATPITYSLTAEELEWYVETALNQDLAAHGSPLRLSLGEQTGATVTLLATRLAAPGETDIDPKPLGALDPTEHTLTHPAFGTAVVTQLEVTGDGLILLPASQSGEAAPAAGEQAVASPTFVFNAETMKWKELTPAATNQVELTPCELKDLIDLEDYFFIADSIDPETGFRLTILWKHSDYFQEGSARFHERGKLSEVHDEDDKVIPGGLARAFLDSYISVVIEKYHGLITALDAGGVLTEEPRVETPTGKKIVDVNHFRGNFVQIDVRQVSQIVVAPKLIEEGRHTNPTRDQRREVELPDGRTLVLDVNYGLPQSPNYGGLFALPDPDNPAKYILVLFTNESAYANVQQDPTADVPYAIGLPTRFYAIFSWLTQSPDVLESSQGLQAVVLSDQFTYLLNEKDERFFIFENLLPFFHPSEAK